MARDGESHGRVMIVGAGPVGLLLANLLGQAGIHCLLVDKRTGLPAESRAIGVTPPSLELLASVGVAETLVARGVPVRDAVVHGDRRRLGTLSFRHLPGAYPFILAVPQRETMRVLEERLSTLATVRTCAGTEFLGLEVRRLGVRAHLCDTRDGRPWSADAALLFGCDGRHSAVRRALGIRHRHKAYGVSFSMADFDGEGGLGRDAHLFFTPAGAVESFPLPGGRRRWIAQTDPGADPPAPRDLVACVKRRAGFDLEGTARAAFSSWRPERLCCETFTRGRVLLCGDAAHVMSPIGGQGMNTGFADAELAAQTVLQARAGQSWARLCDRYAFRRRRAFRAAADRAAAGMWLGTRTGTAARLGAFFMRHCLLRRGADRLLAPHFAMRTIPYGRAGAPGRFR